MNIADFQSICKPRIKFVIKYLTMLENVMLMPSKEFKSSKVSTKHKKGFT